MFGEIAARAVGVFALAALCLGPAGPAGAQVPASTSWLFRAWSGDVSDTSNPLLLLMDGNKAVHASFDRTGGSGPACGIGPELVGLIPALSWLTRRRRARR